MAQDNQQVQEQLKTKKAILGKNTEKEKIEKRYFEPALYKDVSVKPSFFKLEKEGKIFYLLGTYHYVPLEILPNAFLRIIKTRCKNVILESLSSKREDTEENFIKLGFFSKEPKATAWLKQISPIAAEILKNGLGIFCRSFNVNITGRLVMAVHLLIPVHLHLIQPSNGAM